MLTGPSSGSILRSVDREIRIQAEPISPGRCRFVVSEPLLDGGARRFGSAAEAKGSPLAEALFAIPEVSEVVVSGGTVTVSKTTLTPWQATGMQVGAAIRAALAAGGPAVAQAAPVSTEEDERLYGRVADLFEAEINPAVARHGGMVELIDVQDATVLLRMSGGCQGCGMADVTLRQGVEALLKRRLPEIRGLIDVTDHSAGTNPYVTASKK
jgi:Fe-S cluster biogenesis protein NfuA